MTTGPITILILGGYGVFGGRLVQLLADIPNATLIICGRNLEKARRLCAGYSGEASVRPLKLDRRDIAAALGKFTPDLVVDASGPFQAYGNNPYLVIQACIDAGVDYLDFADAADFVFGVSQFDRQASEAGVFVLSGVSSFPVLTAAVLREMARTMDIVSVEGGIAPSPYAGIGLNVMRAVIGYAGAPVKLLRAGVHTEGTGLAESMRFTIATPGKLPLRNTRFSLVDVPDLQVIPPEHPTMKDIWMGAGPVPELLHRILNLLARARARFRLPPLTSFSRIFYTILNLMKFGDHRGGMFVRARGVQDGKPSERSWHLLAEGDDGPFIPSMAVEGVIRKLMAGDRPAAGARAATRALDLADYNRLFKGRSIHTGFRDDAAPGSLYRKLLGPAFDGLPAPVKALHAPTVQRSWEGVARVKRGRGPLARIIAAFIGFPREADEVPVIVTFSPERGGERWTRTFGGRSFNSHQSCGSGRDQHLLVERFGIVAVSLALVVENERLYLVPRRWSVLGLPMPNTLLPSGTSFESAKNDRFHFDVTISFPLVGLVAAYQGSLSPKY